MCNASAKARTHGFREWCPHCQRYSTTALFYDQRIYFTANEEYQRILNITQGLCILFWGKGESVFGCMQDMFVVSLSGIMTVLSLF